MTAADDRWGVAKAVAELKAAVRAGDLVDTMAAIHAARVARWCAEEVACAEDHEERLAALAAARVALAAIAEACRAALDMPREAWCELDRREFAAAKAAAEAAKSLCGRAPYGKMVPFLASVPPNPPDPSVFEGEEITCTKPAGHDGACVWGHESGRATVVWGPGVDVTVEGA